jgi:hypothetical protein
MQCCIGDGGAGLSGLVVLRGRPTGGGRKPPQGAPVKSRGAERLRKSRAVSAAGVGQEGERKRSAEDVSKEIQMTSKPRLTRCLGISLGDTRLPLRWCPA